MTSTDLSTSTFGNEERLPRVPLPSVDASCDRFLEWCAPLLTADELAATEQAVTAFRAEGGAGEKLQAALAEYAALPGVHSWLDEFWERRYLGRRDRIALNANFFFLFEDSALGQVERAAELAAGAVAYKLEIDAQRVAPELQKGAPLSMEQFKYLFAGTRIPGETIDTARTPYSDGWPGPSQARHIVVLRRGHMFRMEVIGPSGVPHSVADLTAGLQMVIDAAIGTEAAPVGHLTTMARAEWAQRRAAFAGLDPANAAALETIETALFCLALDDSVPRDGKDACDLLLHGNSANRWYDKAVTLVVMGDGTAGINGEHCRLDGTTIVSFVDALLSRTGAEHAQRSGATDQGEPALDLVRYVLDDTLHTDVQTAAVAFLDYGATTASATVRLPFTSTRAKELRCSPDAFCQLAFQLAHMRAKGRLGATYESIATRTFHHGRTEAMRVVTPEIVAFVAAMDDPAATPESRRTALRAAADAHVRRARQCQAGDAPEQHLWALQMLHQHRGAELGVPDPVTLYTTPGWNIMRSDWLSTSAVPSPRVQNFGFGSTSPTCIGVGYGIQPDRFDLYLSTPASAREQLPRFADALAEAVTDMDSLLAAEVG